MMAVLWAAALLAQAAAPGSPQAPSGPPATESFLATLTAGDDGVAIGVPSNISSNPGYNNQPHFTPEGESPN